MVESFPPVEDVDSRVLILGSMPGRLSLEKSQYYAHPRNSFWALMGALFAFKARMPYEDRLRALLRNRVALWDVITSCTRSGSLDSAIDDLSLSVNDIKGFIDRHPRIRAIFFNGSKAEQTFSRYVAPGLGDEKEEVFCRCLPSTSPAHAAMSREQKLAEWRIVKEYAAKVLRG